MKISNTKGILKNHSWTPQKKQKWPKNTQLFLCNIWIFLARSIDSQKKSGGAGNDEEATSSPHSYFVLARFTDKPVEEVVPIVTLLVVKVTSWTIVSPLLFHFDLVVACSSLLLLQYQRLDHRSYPGPSPDPRTHSHRSMRWAPEHLNKLYLGLIPSICTQLQMEVTRLPPRASAFAHGLQFTYVLVSPVQWWIMHHWTADVNTRK